MTVKKEQKILIDLIKLTNRQAQEYSTLIDLPEDPKLVDFFSASGMAAEISTKTQAKQKQLSSINGELHKKFNRYANLFLSIVAVKIVSAHADRVKEEKDYYEVDFVKKFNDLISMLLPFEENKSGIQAQEYSMLIDMRKAYIEALISAKDKEKRQQLYQLWGREVVKLRHDLLDAAGLR